MFKRKKCGNCNEKVGKEYNFCPYCRAPINGNPREEDWGMLGKNDMDFLDGVKMPLGFNTIFNSLLKNLNKQFSQVDREMTSQRNERSLEPSRNPENRIKKSGISIKISTVQGKPPEIKIQSFGNSKKEDQKESIQEEVKPVLKSFSERETKKFLSLPRKEPSTEIRRLANKVIYEIKIPGVKSLDEISINQLENSIEIKALTKAKAYSKIIPINLPIKKYNLEKGKLILELDSRD
jgi:HSP20 family molecular chaperone IbpA